MGHALARLAIDFIDARCVDQEQCATFLFIPAGHFVLRCLAMQGAGGKAVFTDQCIEYRGLADTDTPQYCNMDVAMLELVEHGLHLAEIIRKFRARFRWQPRVLHQQLKAVAGLVEMVVSVHAVLVTFAVARCEYRARALTACGPVIPRC